MPIQITSTTPSSWLEYAKHQPKHYKHSNEALPHNTLISYVFQLESHPVSSLCALVWHLISCVNWLCALVVCALVVWALLVRALAYVLVCWAFRWRGRRAWTTAYRAYSTECSRRSPRIAGDLPRSNATHFTATTQAVKAAHFASCSYKQCDGSSIRGDV